MKKTEKKKIAGAGLYIILAACVLSAMTINVVNNARQKKISDTEGSSAVDVKADGVTDDEPKITKVEPEKSEPKPTVKQKLSTNPNNPVKREAPEVVTPPAETAEKEPEKEPGKEPAKESAKIDESSYYTYVMPVDGEMGVFDNKSIVFSETFKDYRVHDGVDIAAKVGSDVVAFASGTVKSVYDDALMGKVVEIDHGGGLVSVYKNLGEELPDRISAGTLVATGDVIGKVGTTALAESADEPHLHFEVCFESQSVDPTAYFTEGK